MDSINSNLSLIFDTAYNRSISSMNETLSILSNKKTQQGLFRGLFGIIVICLPGVIINLKLLRNIKHEQKKETGKILQNILRHVSIAQIAGWPSMFFFLWWIHLDEIMIHAINPCFYRYIGLSLRFLYFVFRFYIGFNSVVVAVCRTCLLVYENQIANFGLNRFKNILYYGSILIPLLIVLLAEATIPIQNYDKYLATESAWCEEDFQDIKDSNERNQSPIYNFTQKYVNHDLIIVVEMFCYFFGFLSISNIIEGILYLHAWTYIIRSDSRSFVQQRFSEESKRKRQRSNAINIQITFMTWLLEFSAGILCAVVYFIDNMVASRWIGFSDITLNFLLIPSMYIINHDVNKALILAHGWIHGFRRMFSHENHNELPHNNENVAANENQASRTTPPPASNIVDRNVNPLEPEATTSFNQSINSDVGTAMSPIKETSNTKQSISSKAGTSIQQNIDSLTKNQSNQSYCHGDLKKPISKIRERTDMEVIAEEVETITLDKSKVSYKVSQTKSKTTFSPKRDNWVKTD